ncbi:MAG: hypothetical protein M1821_004222 [Bathelium mastoideum]|nr:MAG: hypothetical protein M1821_004222 [Bathelium mastoideum]
MAGPLNLTFGVELEFVLLGKTKAEQYGQLEVWKAIHDCIVTDDQEPSRFSSYPVPLHDETTYVTPIQSFSKWQVAEEAALEVATRYNNNALCNSGYEAYPIELISRVFEYHTDHWQAEIASVLDALHSRFNQPSSEFRMLIDERCGFHVHVGNRTAGFPLQTVKNLLQLVTAHEHCFDELHSAGRISGKYETDCTIDGSRYCDPPSAGFIARAKSATGESSGYMESSLLAAWHRDSLRRSAERSSEPPAGIGSKTLVNTGDKTSGTVRRNERATTEPVTETGASKSAKEKELHDQKRSKLPTVWVQSIQRAPDFEKLHDLCGDSSSAYNISNLVPHNKQRFQRFATPDSVEEYEILNSKKTVEFRQHQGSLRKREISAWIEVVCFLMEWAHWANSKRLAGILDPTLIMDASLTAVALLQKLEDPRRLPAWISSYYGTKWGANLIESESREAMASLEQSSPFYNIVDEATKRQQTLRSWKHIQGKVRAKMGRGGYGGHFKTVESRPEDGSWIEPMSYV